MIDKDFKRFSMILVAIAETMNKELSEASFEIYWRILKDCMSIDQFQRAGDLLLRTAKFFPKPAEFIEAVCPNQDDRGIIAYDRVLGAIQEHGTYKTVVFDDPVIHATIESMDGWIEFGRAEPDQWFRKRFLETYKAYARKVQQDGVRGIPPKLIGRTELANKNSGFITKESDVHIGSEKTILCWTKQAQSMISTEDVPRIEAPKGLTNANS